jgi:predicted transposase/invertase (TIGR01784 family)
LLTSQRVSRIYLDELGEVSGQSIGVGIVKLVVETKKKAANLARELFNRANQEIVDEALRKGVLELIERITLYKLPELTPKELEAMFGLDELKKTRYFQEVTQEARQEGKQEAIPNLLKLGLSVEQIAGALNLSVEQVRQIAERSPN